MQSQRIVVVGAALAGLRAVEALRRLENDARITLVGDEADLPYDRPPLSKGVLLGKVEASATALTTSSAVDGLDIDLRLGVKASHLDVSQHRVTLADGEVLDCDAVVLATGSSARWLPRLPRLSGVHVLRTATDAADIRTSLQTGARVAIVGGGFVGAEIASSARSLGLDVTIIDPLPVLMHRGLGDIVGARLTQRHAEAGVRLRLGSTVDGLVGTGRVEGVRLHGGEVIDADLVVIAVGATPNTDWLDGSGLDVGDGVSCDRYLAAAPGVYAIGDVARWHHDLYDESVRMEHWTAAVEHASAVAATLSGTPTVCDKVPYVWTDQLGVKVQIAGRAQPGDEVRFVVDEPDRFLAITGSAGRQNSAVSMNAPGQLVRQRMKLATPQPWPPA